MLLLRTVEVAEAEGGGFRPGRGVLLVCRCGSWALPTGRGTRNRTVCSVMTTDRKLGGPGPSGHSDSQSLFQVASLAAKPTVTSALRHVT